MTTGMDLNLQFPAGWEQAKEIKYSQGFNQPAPRDFVGFGPLTEPEALTIYNFTLMHDFKLVLAYHTQGQEIYWEYGQQGEEYKRDRKIAEILGSESGYAPKVIRGSVGGYKDWCIREMKIPSFTVEVGKDEFKHPLREDCLQEIVQESGEMVSLLTEILRNE